MDRGPVAVAGARRHAFDAGFFLPVAAVLHVATADDRRQAIRAAGALLAGLALPTVPYVIALSIHMGQLAASIRTAAFMYSGGSV